MPVSPTWPPQRDGDARHEHAADGEHGQADVQRPCLLLPLDLEGNGSRRQSEIAPDGRFTTADPRSAGQQHP